MFLLICVTLSVEVLVFGHSHIKITNIIIVTFSGFTLYKHLLHYAHQCNATRLLLQVAVDINHHRTLFDLHHKVSPKEQIVGWCVNPSPHPLCPPPSLRF
jgi:hypothetical protein